jgi:hypothetical protein
LKRIAATLPCHCAAEQRLGLLLQQELEAARFQRCLQHVGGNLVQLAFHQPGHQMHHGDIHAAQLEAVGGFQAEQAAADHHRVLVRGGGGDHLVGVLDVAIADHAGQVVAGHGQHEGRGTGGEQQAVVLFLGAIAGDHLARDAVDLRHQFADMQADAVVGIPAERIEDDVVDGHLARQHRREQDAVVVGVRLGAEHGDVVEVGRELQQVLHGAHAGHAVADHYQFLLLHCVHPLRRSMGFVSHQQGVCQRRIP